MLTRHQLTLASTLGFAAFVAMAASPAPSASICAPHFDPDNPDGSIEAWLDHPLPTDVVPGTTFHLGVTLWDPIHRRLANAQSTALWWRPPDGDVVAPDSEVLNQDWTGHGVADLVVPEMGIGALEIGRTGTTSKSDGTLVPQNAVFAVCGVGPPSDAPLPLVATVSIEVPAPIVAGQPTVVTMILRPKGDWSADTFAMPDQLSLQARIPRGPTLLDVPASLVDQATGQYAVTITLPLSTDYILVPTTGEDTFDTSLIEVSVQSSAGSPEAPSPEPVPITRGQDVVLPLALLVTAGVTFAALILVVRRDR